MSGTGHSSPIAPLLLTSITATLSAVLLLYIHTTSTNTIQKYTPWVDAATEIKLETTFAHLWLEAILSGNSDKSADDVNQHLEQAKWFAIAILDGDRNEEGIFLPLEEGLLRTQVNQLLYSIQNFHKAIDIRLKLPTTPAEPNEQYDQLFFEVIQGANELKQALKRHIKNKNNSQNSLLAMLFIAICLMTIISGYSIWRFTDNRARYLAKLSLANKQISENNTKLKALAHTDQLTGLPNRKMLESITQKALSKVQRNGTVLSLTFIDLDFFKPINDQYGHNTGDKVLINFANAISMQLRDGDTLCRLAGDEFILLIEAETEQQLNDSLNTIITRIENRLSQPIINTPDEIHVRCSAGTAIASKDAIEFEALLHCADLAMYDSKKSGRGQHCYYQGDSIYQTELSFNATKLAQEAAIE